MKKVYLNFTSIIIWLSFISLNGLAALELNLFNDKGLPLYSVKEPDFSLTLDYLKGLANSNQYTPQLEIEGQTVPTGATLNLESGEKFIFNRLLGFGFNTIILETSKGHVLRLVRAPKSIKTGIASKMRHALLWQAYFSEAFLLLSSRVPKKFLVQILDISYQSQYVIPVEALTIETTLDQYLNRNYKKSDLKYQELLEFFGGFKEVWSLGSDFFPMQVGYVPHRGWVLFDYGSGVRLTQKGAQNPRVSSLIDNWLSHVSEIGPSIEAIKELKDNLDKHHGINLLDSNQLTCAKILH